MVDGQVPILLIPYVKGGVISAFSPAMATKGREVCRGTATELAPPLGILPNVAGTLGGDAKEGLANLERFA